MSTEPFISINHWMIFYDSKAQLSGFLMNVRI